MRVEDILIRDHGARLGKTGERLTTKLRSGQKSTVALDRVRSILVSARGVSISSDLLKACARRGITFDIVDYDGVAAARLSGSIRRTPALLRAQVHAADGVRGIALAKALLAGQITTRRSLLRYLRRLSRHADAVDAACRRMTASLEGLPMSDSREEMMGHEGMAAKAYWAAIAKTVPDGTFTNRVGRGAEDRGNRMLNYGYAILKSNVFAMVQRAGLEPSLGLLHADRAGRPSLVLDLMEPWRAIVEDAVFSLLRRSAEADELPTVLNRVVHEVNGRLGALAGTGRSVRAEMQRSTRALAVALTSGRAFEPFTWNVRGPKKPDDEKMLPEELFL